MSDLILPPGYEPPDDQDDDPDKVRESFLRLLDQYERALAMRAIGTATELRQQLEAAFDSRVPRQYQDGEFELKGELYGVVFQAAAQLPPRQRRNPNNLWELFEVLGHGVMQAIADLIEHRSQPRNDAEPFDRVQKIEAPTEESAAIEGLIDSTREVRE